MLEPRHERLSMRNFGIACLIALQAILPCLALAQVKPAAIANPAGFVSSVSGDLFVLDSAGNQVAVKPGDLFGPSTTFISGANSSAVILFADGQKVTLDRDSSLRVSDYRFDAVNRTNNTSTLELLRGTMSYVSGAILTDNPAGLKVSGGNAAVNFLSRDVTAFVMEVDRNAAGIGAVAVTFGEVGVQTPVGSIQKLGADQFSRWQLQSGPTNAAPITSAPAVLQAEVAASRGIVAGSNSPIDVRTAAVLAGLAPTGAGSSQAQQDQQAQATDANVIVAAQNVTPGGGRGCVGSPCR